ncbi:RNA polymerase subunit sigma-24 [Streptomyces sp. AK04-3B]|uniref:RNA polymerase subunit sigma-24 n=1 Tax=Streptomyces sp. AK04-3B TaxID=3028650 RepID=UPI0029A91E7A|nr:RNA polymerase subunit sigma-24 [Streptomyces sp. AK04-3B]MDX3804547.1 RNA polymerase subunit sigma-24 [Streptomyces sp. AK04-3B]
MCRPIYVLCTFPGEGAPHDTAPRSRAREAYAKLPASLDKAEKVTNTQEATPRRQVTVRLKKARETKSGPTTAGPTTASPTTAHPTTSPEPAGAEPAGAEPAGAEPASGPGSPAGPLTPAQAFDALYAFCAPALVRQTYLLSGRRELARESVEQAFQLAWQRWPEVAVDPDPAGWARAAAYEYALSPWHRFRPRYRHPEPPPAEAPDRALLDVLLTLPATYRRTLLLYDGVGLDLPETAAETEASTPAAAYRLLHAREAVAARLPELASPDVLHRRLAEVASAERLRAPGPPAVRLGGERRARFWTRAAIAFTVAIIGATALTARTAPTRYEPPVPPGETVQGVPPRAAPGTLSDAQLKLRAKLRSETQKGPDRLLPRPE